MSDAIKIERHGAEAVARVQPLWEALLDHHVSTGAAGLATIPRDESWPRRRRHYESLFEEHTNIGLWLATRDDSAVGYALAYEDELEGSRAMVLETLSVISAARGAGLGTELMRRVDLLAQHTGIALGVVDVMGGNERARSLYLRSGYEPYSESWLRSLPPESPQPLPNALGRFEEAATRIGLGFSSSPGPDDTWVSADRIVEVAGLSMDGEPRAGEGLDDFIDSLTEAGLWTIRFEIAARPEAAELRDYLKRRGFKMSTERLMRGSAER